MNAAAIHTTDASNEPLFLGPQGSPRAGFKSEVQGVINGIGFRFERRSWIEQGKYLGANAESKPCDFEQLARELGDGAHLIEALQRVVMVQYAVAGSGHHNPKAELPHGAMRVTSGEFRIVTVSAAALAA